MRTRTFPWTHTDAFVDAHCCVYVHAFVDVSVNVDSADVSANTRWHKQRTHLQAYTQRPWQTQTLPYVKLWTVVSRLPTPPMVRLDTDPLQTQTVFLAKVKMFASTVRTSLICSGRHQSRRLRPCRVINEGLIKLRTRLWSLRCTVKAWVCVMHVNFNFPFKSGPKVGLHIVQEYIIFEFLRYICRIST